LERAFITERISAEIDAQMFNELNRTNDSNPQGNIPAGSFGRISWTRGARTIQFGSRLAFQRATHSDGSWAFPHENRKGPTSMRKDCRASSEAWIV